ncbi:unnamed protein product [Caenorhabditis angaria]|uniref:Gustatory receptor n=1 Tax=Caenorhabditis angaria TaxID=860376 RepID=A0A9P1I4H5_9PELO|nr:unnamed protein product [Caenorhabditis angaria]
MIFRIYWMFFQTGTHILSPDWAEGNLYAFLTFESVFVIVAIYQLTSRNVVRKVEKAIGVLKTMRIKENHNRVDSYAFVHIRLLIVLTFIGVSILGSAIYLVANKLVILGTTRHSSWYPYYDVIISFFCFYVHFLYIPIHVLIHSAIQKEIYIFNIELKESITSSSDSQNFTQKFEEIIEKFKNRQLFLQNFANSTMSRFSILLNFGGFLIYLAVLNASYNATVSNPNRPTLYMICNYFLWISTIIITIILLYPQTIIIESVQKTAKLLLSSRIIQENPNVYENSQIMIQRSEQNCHYNNVAHAFRITQKNIKRTFMLIALTVIVMKVTHKFVELGDDIGLLLEKVHNKMNIKSM